MSGFRKFGRIRASYKIELCSDKLGVLISEVRDISAEGLFVCQKVGCDKVAIGDHLHATMTLSSKTINNAQMKVVRKTFDGIGLTLA